METAGHPRISAASDDLRAMVAGELESVLGSDYFRNSKQAERLLRYLVAHSLDEQEDHLRERVIGEKVFGRAPKYDSNSDSIVRVWANHLRKRLAQYYQGEQRSSGLRFAIRPGSYRVEFHPVVAEIAAPVAVEHVPEPAVSKRLSLWVVGTIVLAVACGALVYQNMRLMNQARAATVPPPLNLLWSRLFAPQQASELVLADASLSLFQDVLGQPVSLQDYIRHRYLLMGSGSANEKTLAMLMARRYTNTADADMVRRAIPLAAMSGGRMDVYYARDFSPDDLKRRNVILLGSKRSNPWVQPFENQMNFRFENDETRGVGVLVNTNPRAGEQGRYSAELTTESYGLVAFLPNLGHTGNVLIVAGLGMQGTLAGAEMVTNPDLFKQVVALTGTNARGELPYFEAVLRIEMMGSTVHQFRIVAWRRSGG